METLSIEAGKIWPGMILIGFEHRGRVQDVCWQKNNPDNSTWLKIEFTDKFEGISFDSDTMVKIRQEV